MRDIGRESFVMSKLVNLIWRTDIVRSVLSREATSSDCFGVELVTLVNPIAVHVYVCTQSVGPTRVLSQTNSALETTNLPISASIQDR